MHQEILNQQQLELLPLMAQFSREYYLVGGTAIALHLGHRRSIDFDMFKASTINHRKNLERIKASGLDYTVTRHVAEQMNLIVNAVKVTLFSEKMFRVQLSYFEDIDYSEQVDYLIQNPPTDEEIKSKLTDISTTIL